MSFSDVEIAEKSDDHWVARICFVSPSNSEDFALSLMLLERPISGLHDIKTWKVAVYATFMDPANAMGFYDYNNQYKKSLYEALKIRSTPTAARFLFIIE